MMISVYSTSQNLSFSPAHYQGLLYVMLTAIHTTHTEDEVPALIPYIAKPRPTQCDVGTHITVCLVHIQSPCVLWPIRVLTPNTYTATLPPQDLTKSEKDKAVRRANRIHNNEGPASETSEMWKNLNIFLNIFVRNIITGGYRLVEKY